MVFAQPRLTRVISASNALIVEEKTIITFIVKIVSFQSCTKAIACRIILHDTAVVTVVILMPSALKASVLVIKAMGSSINSRFYPKLSMIFESC